MSATEFSEYPIFLRHPDHTEATRSDYAFDNSGNGTLVPAVEAKYPDVFAANAVEEASWLEKGYRRTGNVDPEGIQRLKAGTDSSYVPTAFPKWIASHNRIVVDAIEEAKLLGLPIPRRAEEIEADRLRDAQVEIISLRAQLEAIQKRGARNGRDI